MPESKESRAVEERAGPKSAVLLAFDSGALLGDSPPAWCSTRHRNVSRLRWKTATSWGILDPPPVSTTALPISVSRASYGTLAWLDV